MRFAGISAIFLDYDGVLNDIEAAQPKWRRLVGEFFPGRLGGSPEAWRHANRQIFPGVYERSVARLAAQAGSHLDMPSEMDVYKLDWLRSMCAIVGVASPPETECLALAREAHAWIIPQVASPFPGVPGIIAGLASQHTLFTASNGLSGELAVTLQSMAISPYFRRLYGSDLVHTFKFSPAYYERVFEHAGVKPDEALVLDDNPSCVMWARQAGAQAVLVSRDAGMQEGDVARISGLGDLPGLLGITAG